MIFAILFLSYLVLCGIIALYEVMNLYNHHTGLGWLHTLAAPGLLFFIVIIESLSWVTERLKGK